MIKHLLINYILPKLRFDKMLHFGIVISYVILAIVVTIDPQGKNQKLTPHFYLLLAALAFLYWIFKKARIVVFVAFLLVILFRLWLYFYL